MSEREWRQVLGLPLLPAALVALVLVYMSPIPYFISNLSL